MEAKGCSTLGAKPPQNINSSSFRYPSSLVQACDLAHIKMIGCDRMLGPNEAGALFSLLQAILDSISISFYHLLNYIPIR